MKVRDQCLPDNNGKYDVDACNHERKYFRTKNCIVDQNIESKSEGGDPFTSYSSGSRSIAKGRQGQISMRETARKRHRTYFCCERKIDGNTYSFVGLSSALEQVDLAAFAALTRQDGALDTKHIVVAKSAHKLVNGSVAEWDIPKVLRSKTGDTFNASSGYWVQLSPVMLVLDPKKHSLGCDQRIIRAVRVVLDEDERGLLLEELQYMKLRLSKICQVVSDVELFIEVGGYVRLNPVAPAGDEETCMNEVQLISAGISKCVEQIRTLRHVMPET